MALEKVISEDKIEIVGEYKHVQVRTCTKVLEDGVELSPTGEPQQLTETTQPLHTAPALLHLMQTQKAL
jgi:hypothetical protein